MSDEGRPGDLAVIFDDRRRFLAVGLYDPTSPIRVRVLAHGAPESIDCAWLCAKLAAAVACVPLYRKTALRVIAWCMAKTTSCPAW